MESAHQQEPQAMLYLRDSKSCRHSLVRTLLNEMFGTSQCHRGDCGRRIHATGRRPDAAVENEQIWHVVTAAPSIDDARRWIVAHFCRTQKMPAGFADQRRDDRLVGPRGLQRFLSASQM